MEEINYRRLGGGYGPLWAVWLDTRVLLAASSCFTSLSRCLRTHTLRSRVMVDSDVRHFRTVDGEVCGTAVCFVSDNM